VNRPRHEALRPLVDALGALLETAGPRAQAFLNHWPPELIARPVGRRPLPVVAALRVLSRLAAPAARGLVEAVKAQAHDLDWRQTYGKADFSERFVDNYDFNEWIGERGAFISDRIACGVLRLMGMIGIFGVATEQAGPGSQDRRTAQNCAKEQVSP
jgi:dimethlysulfoniopropionate lyase